MLSALTDVAIEPFDRVKINQYKLVVALLRTVWIGLGFLK